MAAGSLKVTLPVVGQEDRGGPPEPADKEEGGDRHREHAKSCSSMMVWVEKSFETAHAVTIQTSLRKHAVAGVSTRLSPSVAF